MRSTDRLTAAFWSRVANNTGTTSAGLGVLRIISAFFLLLFEAPRTSWVSHAPPAFFNPPFISLARLVPGFPPAPLLLVLDVISIVLICFVLLGIRARMSTLLFVALNVLSLHFVYSFGKIDHDILVWVFLVCMAFSGWGRTLAWLPDRDSRLDSLPRSLALIGVCVGFAMSSVGFQKALNWLDFDRTTGGFLSWFVVGYFEFHRHWLLADYVLELPPLSFELLDYIAVTFELGCFFALLLNRVTWRLWLLCAGLFHLINTLVLNIPFLIHFPVYLAFVDFSRLQALIETWSARLSVRLVFVTLVGSLGLTHILLRLVGRGSSFLLVVDKVQQNHVVLYSSVGVWTVAVVILFVELRLALLERDAVALQCRALPQEQRSSH
jgi:hypothetical protein